ncbi:MAG: hypothetical protein FWG38_04545, partial [Defluviitaleaceae bacterium]|nr:hypothetical protein [Defluviitaleaceae bacterium]
MKNPKVITHFFAALIAAVLVFTSFPVTLAAGDVTSAATPAEAFDVPAPPSWAARPAVPFGVPEPVRASNPTGWIWPSSRGAWEHLDHLISEASQPLGGGAASRTINIHVDMTQGGGLNRPIQVGGTGITGRAVTIHIRTAPGVDTRTITANAARLFEVAPGSTLILDNIILDGDRSDINNNEMLRSDSGGVFVDSALPGVFGAEASRGALHMLEGSVIQNSRASYGGGVELDGGRLVMHGGEIRYNRATTAGGGVSAHRMSTWNPLDWRSTRAQIEILGGSIHSNFARHTTLLFLPPRPGFDQPQDSFGGGLYIYESDLTMRGGDVSNNRAHWGAGVNVRGTGVMSGFDIADITPDDGIFTMYGGSITNNTAIREARPVPSPGGYGGGVRVCRHGLFHMHGGTISHNEALGGGGVSIGYNSFMYGSTSVAPTPGRMYMHGGYIQNNTVNHDGGGISIQGGRTFGGFGGTRGLLVMADGTIYNNTAHRDGGGIWVQDNCRLVLGWVGATGTSQIGTPPTPRGTALIDSNTAGRNGGGVYVNDDTCTWMNLVTISNNQALGENHANEFDGRGGGMFIRTVSRSGADGGQRGIYQANLAAGAYLPGTEMRLTENVRFTGNQAAAGAFRPPLNVAPEGAWGRIPVTASVSVPGHGNPINNWDINFLYEPHRIEFPAFTITFHLYDCYEGDWEYVVVPVEVDTTLDLEALDESGVPITHQYGTPGAPGWALWGWFDAPTLATGIGREDLDEYGRREGLRRPAVGSVGFDLTATITEEMIDELFDEAGNLDLFVVWALWGDADDNDVVDAADITAIGRF